MRSRPMTSARSLDLAPIHLAMRRTAVAHLRPRSATSSMTCSAAPRRRRRSPSQSQSRSRVVRNSNDTARGASLQKTTHEPRLNTPYLSRSSTRRAPARLLPDRSRRKIAQEAERTLNLNLTCQPQAVDVAFSHNQDPNYLHSNLGYSIREKANHLFCLLNSDASSDCPLGVAGFQIALHRGNPNTKFCRGVSVSAKGVCVSTVTVNNYFEELSQLHHCSAMFQH